MVPKITASLGSLELDFTLHSWLDPRFVFTPNQLSGDLELNGNLMGLLPWKQSFKFDYPSASLKEKFTSPRLGHFEIREMEVIPRGTRIVIELKKNCNNFSKKYFVESNLVLAIRPIR